MATQFSSRAQFTHRCRPTHAPLISVSVQCFRIFSRKNLLWTIPSALCTFQVSTGTFLRLISLRITSGIVLLLLLEMFVSTMRIVRGFSASPFHFGDSMERRKTSEMRGVHKNGTWRTGTFAMVSRVVISSGSVTPSRIQASTMPSNSRRGRTTGKMDDSISSRTNGLRRTHTERRAT